MFYVSPFELIGFLILILILIVIFKPDLIVRFGRSLGEVKKEFKKGELDEETRSLAARLGIDVSGKSREQVLAEIDKKLKSLASS